MAENVEKTLVEYGLNPSIIASSLDHPSVICHVTKPGAKKTIWLETALDTTPPGNTKKWQSNPLIVRKDGDRLFGLGISDSKVAIALYSILAKRLSENPEFKGNLFLGFDAREQSGEFLGIKDVLPHVPHSDVCILGYQDYNDIHIGARGFLRIKVTTLGQSVHTGSRRKKGVNAIHNMNIVMANILSISLENKDNAFFHFGNSINLSMIEGGYGINIVPDVCSIWVDI